MRETGWPDHRPDIFPAEREVFASLSEGELAIITSVQSRLNGVAGAVEGQSDSNNAFC